MTSYLVQVVVKICISSTKISSKQGSVRGEDRGHGNLAGAGENQSRTCLPLVKMTNNIGLVPQLVRQLENKSEI